MWRAVPLLIAAPCAFAQGQPPSRLVRLDVAATDAKGNPVTDLQASDIQAREDGQLRPIVFFRFAEAKGATAPAAGGETVNRTMAPTLILFDRLNEGIMPAVSESNNVGAALQRLQSAENIFVYFLTSQGDLFPAHALPSPDAGLRGLTEPTPLQLRSKFDDAVRTLNGFRGTALRNDDLLRMNTTLQALSTLIWQMGAIAGRKNLIWVTHGFPLIDLTDKVRALSAVAAQFRIAIYPVGADLGATTLQMFASLSGGRAYRSDNTPEALHAAIADGQGSYRLAYYTPDREKDKKEHKIRLQSSRKGVRLLTIDGYFGEPPEPDPTEAEALFTNECHSPFNATEIGLRVKLSPQPEGKLHIGIRINPADLLLEQQEGNYHGQLALMVAFYSQGSLKSAPAPLLLDVNLTPDQYHTAQEEGIDVSRDLLLSSEIDKIRVIVLDRKMYSLGSVTLSSPK